MSTTASPVSSAPLALGRARLPRVDRTVLMAIAVAGLVGLAIGLAGLGGVDDAAHRYQASVFSVDGWTAWDNYWYAGRYGVVNYSLLFYPLAAVLGVVTVAVLAVTASAGSYRPRSARLCKAAPKAGEPRGNCARSWTRRGSSCGCRRDCCRRADD
jgi:hypothetical protein